MFYAIAFSTEQQLDVSSSRAYTYNVAPSTSQVSCANGLPTGTNVAVTFALAVTVSKFVSLDPSVCTVTRGMTVTGTVISVVSTEEG